MWVRVRPRAAPVPVTVVGAAWVRTRILWVVLTATTRNPATTDKMAASVSTRTLAVEVRCHDNRTLHADTDTIINSYKIRIVLRVFSNYDTLAFYYSCACKCLRCLPHRCW